MSDATRLSGMISDTEESDATVLTWLLGKDDCRALFVLHNKVTKGAPKLTHIAIT